VIDVMTRSGCGGVQVTVFDVVCDLNPVPVAWTSAWPVPAVNVKLTGMEPVSCRWLN
jgi:hypothetical protein